MLYYDRIGVREGIDADKTTVSKYFIICDYWYFVDKGLKFQPDHCMESVVFGVFLVRIFPHVD